MTTLYKLTSTPDYSLDHEISPNKIPYYFILFLIIHTLIWTLAPYFFRPSLPHDTLESITWGLQWEWGYHKHPFLTAWLCAGIYTLFNQADWAIYLLAQVVNSSTFIAVWYLAKLILPIRHALIATLVLEGVLFYNLNSFNLTSDSLQAPLWAFLALFLYKAITKEQVRYWLLTAFFAACGVCTKYQTLLLIGTIFLFICIEPSARLCFKKRGIYYSIGFFLLLLSPHLLWLYQHHFITLIYALNTTAEYTATKTVWGHLLYPLLALTNDLLYLAPVLLLIWPFFKNNKDVFRITSFQWNFLISLGLAPALLTLIINILDGNYFPPRWSTAYFFPIGIMLLAYLKPKLSPLLIKKFALNFILFSSLLFALRWSSFLYLPNSKNDAFLPNQTMALALHQLWTEHYSSPLPYLAGSNYLVSLLIPYLPDHPKPFLNWQFRQSPWVEESMLREKGAIFIWDAGANYGWDLNGRETFQLPKEIANSYPDLVILPQLIFHRISDRTPVEIGVAILPPKSHSTKYK